MKKLLGVLLTLLCLLPLAAAADEVEVTWLSGKNKLNAEALRDGSDETQSNLSAKKEVLLTCTLPEDTAIQSLYARMDSVPASVELQVLNSKKKWETVAQAETVTSECLLTCAEPVTGRLRLRMTYARNTITPLKELRLFTEAAPESVRRWEVVSQCDLLLLLDDLGDLDVQQVKAWEDSGCSVLVAAMSVAGSPLESLDELWGAGVRTAPTLGGYGKMGKTAKDTLNSWGKIKTPATIASWLRRYDPLVAVNAGEVTALALDTAVTDAANPKYEVENASKNGIWRVPARTDDAGEALSLLETLPQKDREQLLRELCRDYFKEAYHADPALIPYPERDADGYLTEGEFLHEDEKNGLWAYLSPTVQVEIRRYEKDRKPYQRYFVAEVRFKPESEQLKQYTWTEATRSGQTIYPPTLAQSNKLVIGINSDYYIYRKQRELPIGNVIRNGEILYSLPENKSLNWPILDTIALHDDGSMSVYGVHEVTAEELLAQGDVHDALSFGPYGIRDGKLRLYHGKSSTAGEPRTSIGMVAPGHYYLVACEGRLDKQADGMGSNETSMLLYSLGCQEGFLLDGGNTSVMVFMGTQLNHNGGNKYPRNQHELFGVGTSDLVHTDWLDGRPK